MNASRADNPLIVQSDLTVLVEIDSPRYVAVRDLLLRFSELVKSPEHVHTYRLSPLSIWNACSAGMSCEEMIAGLVEFAKYPPPASVLTTIRDFAGRYGRVKLTRTDDSPDLLLTISDPVFAEELIRRPQVLAHLGKREGPCLFRVAFERRGLLKRALVTAGFPAEDLAGYAPGESLALRLRPTTLAGLPFYLRRYQSAAVDAFHCGGGNKGGSGVVVLPCGAGKTIVGMACMAAVGMSTLIVTTGVTAVRQWITELLDKTNLSPDLIGEYTSKSKDIKPVTVTTYQILTYRSKKDGPFEHLGLFEHRNWGLILYDEVHVLPAPVFQITAGLQARRRLGLTATLIREDGHEDDVFALIGPKKADVPWKDLEAQGWIAKAVCTEVRLAMPGRLRMPYALAGSRDKFRIASENPLKAEVVRRLLRVHNGEPALIIGMYVDQLKDLATELNVPLITGSTAQTRREELYAEFRAGRLPSLVVSKVANFAIDLPDASLAIQVSGTFGSRQEEAQRLGRILRPKPGLNQAAFYSLVSQDTVEQEFSLKRQLFLCEQGYTYAIVDEAAIGISNL